MTDLPPRSAARLAALAGLSASLVGIGLARFAYTPLLPALVDGGWFAPSAAAYLGAANLAGYLLGALGGARVMRRLGPGWSTRAMMGLAAASLIACAWPLGFEWFFVWRLLSGFAGGAVMVAASSLVMLQTPAEKRGRAGGLMFTGVGIGIVFSGAALPWLIGIGLTTAWLALGGLSLMITLAAWPLADDARLAPARAPVASGAGAPDGRALARALKAVTILYGLCAFGLVPHMVFLVDYVARGLERGLAQGALIWTLFGVGALIGPMATGRLADRIGFAAALRWVVALEAAVVALLLLSAHPAAIAASAVIGGMLTPGLVPVTLGRVRELSGETEAAKAAAWGKATAGFAVGQAVGAYLLAWVFDLRHDYHLLFQLALAAPALGLALEFVAVRGARRRDRGEP
ncbi:MAG: YbfB/YjiJ family MFS transporter [Marivibrio sp.]|uniref:YbfB/YjiJ family MFS transporter n=1 Tax=Marivibrio sp. TaxID=2039719 RepID=UPI0032ECC887